MGIRGRPLPASKVRQIERHLRNRGGRSLRQVAERYGVGYGTVQRISKGSHREQLRPPKTCPGCGSQVDGDACLVCQARGTAERAKLKMAA